MPFKGKDQTREVPASPEASYCDLPRRPDAVPGLWLHQGDLMRAYAADHLDTADLALELPTGFVGCGRCELHSASKCSPQSMRRCTG